jgi:hypothetical protein
MYYGHLNRKNNMPRRTHFDDHTLPISSDTMFTDRAGRSRRAFKIKEPKNQITGAYYKAAKSLVKEIVGVVLALVVLAAVVLMFADTIFGAETVTNFIAYLI